MQCLVLKFLELSTTQLYDLLTLRAEVFVVEQDCPYLDLDGKDRHSETRHLLFVDEQQNLHAYSRVLAPKITFDETSIGRVLVKESARGSGLAHRLMKQSISLSQLLWVEHNIKISAQCYLIEFYQRHGFKVVSEMYLEDGLEHVEMLRLR
ncbi:MAG TPA: GNAT family N-acetyltransferase [Psychromonas hadalis]|nr:GNAT family N-acetyltransferase [Psychromonas hadalis]